MRRVNLRGIGTYMQIPRNFSPYARKTPDEETLPILPIKKMTSPPFQIKALYIIY